MSSDILSSVLFIDMIPRASVFVYQQQTLKYLRITLRQTTMLLKASVCIHNCPRDTYQDSVIQFEEIQNFSDSGIIGKWFPYIANYSLISYLTNIDILKERILYSCETYSIKL